MKRWFLTTIIMLLPLLATSQDRPFDYKAFESKVKKYIRSNPDSVKILVQGAFKQKNLHDTIRGNLYNIYAIYYNTLGKEDSAITNFKKAIVLFKGHPRMITRPHMNIATAYRSLGRFDESFSHLDQALEIAKTNKLRVYEGIIYGNYASNYNVLQDYNKSVEYCLKSIDILKKENDPGQLIASQQKLANNYMMMRNFEFAADMYRDCLAGFKKAGDMSNYYNTLVNYSECLGHLEKYAHALKVLDEAIAGLKKINNQPNLAIAYTKVASIANTQKDYNKAVDNYEKAFVILANTNSVYVSVIAAEYIELLNKINRYQESLKVMDRLKILKVYPNTPLPDRNRLDIAIAEAYAKTNDGESAIAGLKKAIAVKDSLNNLDSEKKALEVQAKFQAAVQREKNLALEANNKLLRHDAENKKSAITLYTSGAIALILLVLMLLRAFVLKNRLQQQQLGTAGADIRLLQEKHMHEQQLSEAQRDMIDEKQRELTSTTLRMASFQNAINDIIDKCDEPAIGSLADIKNQLRILIKQQDYWKQFETRFNSLHPDFSNNLQNRYHNLTRNDVEFCSLLKLNLSNKEIASLLQISHESAITKKYRIKKKMEISSDEAFEELLAAI